MLSAHFPALRTVLCLGAHADDIEIGCGGAMLRLLAENPGLRVHWVVLSAQGPRIEEAQRGAESFLKGALERQVEVLSFRDSYFPYEGAVIKDFFHDLSRRVSPDLIFTHRLEDAHQDHRLVAELTGNAFRDQVILEYEIPKFDGDLGRPNFYCVLSRAHCDEKVALLSKAFPSQAARPWFTDETFRSLLRIRGIECKSPSGYAEAFTARKLVF